MKNLLRLTLGLFVLLMIQSCKVNQNNPPKVKKKGVAFVENSEKDLTDVIDKANAQDKLVFVDVYADWCTPCKLMDEDVFSEKTTAAFLNEHFINYKVNGEKFNGPNLALIFGVEAYPTLLFLDGNGRVLEKKVGAAYHRELLGLAKKALEKNEGVVMK